MRIYLVRHGQTVVSRDKKEAWESYGLFGPPLSNAAIEKSHELSAHFGVLGIDVESEVAATSEYLRARQTAEYAGFTSVENPLLNEVKTTDSHQSRAMLKEGKVPEEAEAAARALLRDMPAERIWFTHGLIIAGLLYLTGQTKSQDLEPPFATIITIDV